MFTALLIVTSYQPRSINVCMFVYLSCYHSDLIPGSSCVVRNHLIWLYFESGNNSLFEADLRPAVVFTVLLPHLCHLSRFNLYLMQLTECFVVLFARYLLVVCEQLCCVKYVNKLKI